MNTHTLFAGVALAALCGAASTALAARAVEREAVVAAAAPDAQVDFEIFLPLRDPAGLEALVRAQHTPGSSLFHAWITPAQFAERFGPTPASLARAQAAIRAAGLRVTDTGARSFHVSGDATHAGRLIGAPLILVSSPSGGTRLMAMRDPVLPDALLREGARIAAFTGIPARRPNSAVTGQAAPENRYSTVGTYWFTDLKQAYDYPSFVSPGSPYPVANGAGVRVAVLMSDLIYSSDVTNLFTAEKYAAITKRASPTVSTIKVDGGGVQGGPGSFEASLDVQQVLGGAPGASVTLVSIPDLTDQHIMDGYNYVVKRNAFDIVNSSFGGCELEYTAPYNGGVDYTYILKLYSQIFLQGNAQGITFVASSGDQGGVMCPSADYGVAGASPTFVAGVSTPADDPRVTAVGGGNLVTTSAIGSLNSAYVRESAYGDLDAPYDIYSIGQNVSGGYWGAGGGGERGVRRAGLPDAGQHRIHELPDRAGRRHAGGRHGVLQGSLRLAGDELQRRRQLGDHRLQGRQGRRLLLHDRHLGRLAGVRGGPGPLRADQPPAGQCEHLSVRPGPRPDPGGRRQRARRQAVLPPRHGRVRRRLGGRLPQRRLRLHLRQRQSRRAQAVRADRLRSRRRAADRRQSLTRGAADQGWPRPSQSNTGTTTATIASPAIRPEASGTR